MATIATKQGSRAGLIVVATLATLIALISIATYASGSLERLAAEQDNTIAGVYAEASGIVHAAFYAHIVGGTTSLLLGPVQFSRRLRGRFPRTHRITGRIYLSAVLVGGVAGLVIAPHNSAGAIGTAGFGTLAILWLATAVVAFRHAVARRLDHHRAWMIRNYSLTFAGVMLRIWLPLLIVGYSSATGADVNAAFAWGYAIVPFLCWVPNLLFAEWLVRRRGLPPFPARR